MPADEIELDVTDVAHGGVFVGRHLDAESAERGGRVVFVPDAVPGERVRVRLSDTSKASFWRGEVLEVLTPSPHRRPHIWPEAGLDVPPSQRPGGADFGHIALDHQRALKRQVIGDALRRTGGLEAPVTIEGARASRDAEESVDGTGWRTRVSVHVDDDGRVGPYAARSHRVIGVGNLPLATAEIAEAFRALGRRPAGRIDLVQPADGRVRLIERPAGPDRRGGRGPRRGGASSGRAVDPAARETIVETVAGRRFQLDAAGFWQVHRLAAGTISEVLVEMLAEGPGVDPDALHLDLYGGVGLLASAVASLGGRTTRILTVESDPRATEHAGANLAEWVGARAETGRVDRWLPQWAMGASAQEKARLRQGVVVLDPPRAGAGRDVVEAVVGLAPAAVAYVACDPVALARDLATFAAAGYRPGTVRGLDLFPNSHHVEALVLLTREGPVH